MNDSPFKRFEIWFRRMTIRLFGFLFRRNNIYSESIDFNSCKYLFIRQDRIGDVLVSTPIFTSIKQHYPQARIDVLLSPNNYFVLENSPLIHTRWIYQKKIWKIISLVRALRKERYDFIIDLLDNPSATSTFFCLASKAKWNVGIHKDNKYAYDISVPLLSRRDTHIIDRLAQLLLPFHIDPKREQKNVWYQTSVESDVFARQFIDGCGIAGHRLIGINISAGTKTRFWGEDNFIRLGRYIQETHPDYRLVLLYKPGDQSSAENIITKSGSMFYTVQTTSFDQFAAIIKNTYILITPDTAAVHLASAFHIGAVVLYVQSNKNLRIWEPYGTLYESIVTDRDDLSTISFEQVQKSFNTLIQRMAQADVV